jgi:hypothetical protein
VVAVELLQDQQTRVAVAVAATKAARLAAARASC